MLNVPIASSILHCRNDALDVHIRIRLSEGHNDRNMLAERMTPLKDHCIISLCSYSDSRIELLH